MTGPYQPRNNKKYKAIQAERAANLGCSMPFGGMAESVYPLSNPGDEFVPNFATIAGPMQRQAEILQRESLGLIRTPINVSFKPRRK